jgi:hypothetical protein
MYPRHAASPAEALPLVNTCGSMLGLFLGLLPPFKCLVTLETGRGQTPIRMEADQSPVAIIVFIPQRKVPFPPPLEIEINNVSSAIAVPVYSKQDGVRLLVGNNQFRSDLAAAIRIVCINVGVVILSSVDDLARKITVWMR